jgi:hypothetical protein
VLFSLAQVLKLVNVELRFNLCLSDSKVHTITLQLLLLILVKTPNPGFHFHVLAPVHLTYNFSPSTGIPSIMHLTDNFPDFNYFQQ